MKLSDSFKSSFAKKFARDSEMSITGYLELCKTDKMAYANAAERMLAAIGEPNIVDRKSVV